MKKAENPKSDTLKSTKMANQKIEGPQIEGLYTAMITPFDAQDKVDEKGLRMLIMRQLTARVSGIMVLGTTGEAPTLENYERDEIIKTAIDEAQGKIPVMVGCGTYCTKTTIDHAKQAQKYGASSLLIVVPYYNRPTQEGIYEHFKAISSEVSIPICIYNIASRTGKNLETDTLERLAQLPHIVSVKDSSGSLSQLTDVLERIAFKKRFFSLLSGDDAVTFPLLALGGHGVISVLSNLVPRAVKKLIDTAQEDLVRARAIHYSLKPLVSATFIETNPIPIKSMMQIAGLPSGKCKLPLTHLEPANEQKLQELMKNCSIIWKETPTSVKSQVAISFKKSETEKMSSLIATLEQN